MFTYLFTLRVKHSGLHASASALLLSYTPSSWFNLSFINYISSCLSVFCACMSALCVPGACGHHKTMKDPLGMNLQVL